MRPRGTTLAVPADGHFILGRQQDKPGPPGTRVDAVLGRVEALKARVPRVKQRSHATSVRATPLGNTLRYLTAP